MSQYFEVGDLVLWNPSNGVARLYARTGEAVAPLVELPTGIGPMIADEYEIDLDVFVAFVDALTGYYLGAQHPILRSLMEGFLATSIVMVQRAGRELPALREQQRPHWWNVSVTTRGVAPTADRDELLDLVAEHAMSMAR
ncbi:hypothetical protein ACWT_1305 [Actinoplanes sp. SE50]|uniref:DUF6086 family protein n=1 Tax=unclassified Actinoplanes TaxID=2626549 RepID=UPI00023EBCBA|nr:MULTISPECIES: DUF6086 family protein [unclassified Actinoplanes]AEV82323.1 hypothetical protein ACPL_1426 [Actinoplanes sp. SE50/110]ATO80720.1 hypothetical protein ACWT_1305 [Actinoplanes sp. SE50]SLL98127.1 hypothetical protein ACSP50_1349 [Actinoplanes sp. SE50/110]